MARAIQCDRCKCFNTLEVVNGEKSGWKHLFPDFEQWQQNRLEAPMKDGHRVSLCPPCAGDFDRFVRNLSVLSRTQKMEVLSNG
jgi:hypothetical protein